MNANAENLERPFRPQTEQVQSEGKLRLAENRESQLRSRLLEMILDNEQIRKYPASLQR